MTFALGSKKDDVPAHETRPRRRRVRVLVAVVVLALALFAAMTFRLFVYPDLNAPVPSDAIVVLGGQSAQGTDEADRR